LGKSRAAGIMHTLRSAGNSMLTLEKYSTNRNGFQSLRRTA
jgi:hypothetical protein